MRKFLLIISIFFIYSCNTTNVAPIGMSYLDSANTCISGNNIKAENLLNKYTNFSIGEKDVKYHINLIEDSSNFYSINKKGNIITITGNTLQGVVYFLDKYVGVRFYMPTDLWVSKPKDSIFVDTIISINHIPFTSVIFSTGYKTQDEIDWANKNNIYNNSYGSTSHTMSSRFYDTAMFKLFPDIYNKNFPTNPNDPNFEPDFTKSDIVGASMYSARKFFIANPSLNYISFSVMDSQNGYPSPIAGETLSQTFTKYIKSLSDSFAIVFPNKYITYLIYGKVNQWPIPYLLRSNVIPISVIHFANAVVNNVIDSASATIMAKTTLQLGNHDWAEGNGFIVPRIYSRLIQQVFQKDIYTTNVKFKFAHLEMYPNWSFGGMKYYEMAKIYDNPSIDIDSIRSLFCKDMFGDAGVYMKSYFDALEKLSISMNNNSSIKRVIGSYSTQMVLTLQDSALKSSARQYIDKALTITTGIEHERAQFFSNGLRIPEGLWEIHDKKEDDNFISSYENFLTDSIKNNEMYLNSATDTNFITTMKDFINTIK